MPQSTIAEKLKAHNYRPQYAIFAPLFPLVGMMWADNRIQHEEAELFITHSMAYFKRLNEEQQKIHEFTLYGFVDQAIKDMQFACYISDLAMTCPIFEVHGENLHPEILDAAIDIAAAAEIKDLSGKSVRVTDGEKWWIKKLTMCLAGVHDDPDHVQKAAKA